MNELREQIKARMLANPELLLEKKPFTRGTSELRLQDYLVPPAKCGVRVNDKMRVRPSRRKMLPITQDQYAMELDQYSHKVLYDDNIPSITTKTKDGGFIDIEYKKMPVPFQRMILNKQVLHLCGNKMQFTLMNTNPTDKQKGIFTTFKQYWDLRNQDGMKTELVTAQKSYGDAGLLYYFNHKNEIKSRLISYKDGFTIISHNDQNGERLLECIYYETQEGEVIEVYDERYHYTYTSNPGDDGGWHVEQDEHGFNEIPLITKRGQVAWDNVQDIIEVYEIIYNIFLVLQKKHGWGILYIRGKFKENAQKIAGNIVLNDTNMQDKGTAQYLDPPSPQNMIETLDMMKEMIQMGAGTTFLLPKDIKSTGDISAQAIMLTQSLDIENALQSVIDYQNVADKMTRLFKYGLAVELLLNGKNSTAVTDFADININGKFKLWRPKNDTDYNSMLIQLNGAGLISQETGIEKNTESSPDELQRINKERTLGISNRKKTSKNNTQAIGTEGTNNTKTDEL